MKQSATSIMGKDALILEWAIGLDVAESQSREIIAADDDLEFSTDDSDESKLPIRYSYVLTNPEGEINNVTL